MSDAERDSEALSGRPPHVAAARGRRAQKAPLLVVAAADRRDAPIGAAAFAAAFEALRPALPLALAVSGGPDSMALFMLVANWARSRGIAADQITVLTVDHGLRPEARREAELVGAWVAARGHPHVILCREGVPPTRNLQAAARTTRFDLLARWCQANAVRDLVLAHHLDDQAETFLLRLGRGSGVDGLSAMAAVSDWPFAAVGERLRVLRPLLGFPKARLIATLEPTGQEFVADPSNADPRFARARLRSALPGLAAEHGLTPARLAATAKRMARARRALEAATTDLLRASADFDPAGYCRLDAQALRSAPEEIALRALAVFVRAVGGGAYPPRLERLERLHAAIVDGALGGGRTLSGCRILPDRAGGICVIREAARVAGPLTLAPERGGVWDGRFFVRWSGEEGDVSVKALGHAGWREAARDGRPEGLPSSAVGRTLPGFWRGADLLAVPNLAYIRPGCRPADFVAEFLPLRSDAL